MINIMMVDDDEDDRFIFQEAIAETRLLCNLKTAIDGQDMLDQLQACADQHLPDLILLDLNMPGMDGREALATIKRSERLKTIPIVILTTSTSEEDIIRSYKCGASSFISKPVTFDDLCKKITTLTNYWFDVVNLPNKYR